MVAVVLRGLIGILVGRGIQHMLRFKCAQYTLPLSWQSHEPNTTSHEVVIETSRHLSSTAHTHDPQTACTPVLHHAGVHESGRQVGDLICVHVVYRLRSVISEVILSLVAGPLLLQTSTVDVLTTALTDAVNDGNRDAEEDSTDYHYVGYHEHESDHPLITIGSASVFCGGLEHFRQCVRHCVEVCTHGWSGGRKGPESVVY